MAIINKIIKDKTEFYIPISCSFYDYLEEAATLRKVSIIEFEKEDKTVIIESIIKTFFIKDKVEYMLLGNKQSIRLDNLISFNGKPLPKNC
ncbi:MAG: Rho-binding antiterminator [Cyclobacteriaceae bacterium]|nr:Rho-binding antiterminator [Cyclobacteriaceae bacterium]